MRSSKFSYISFYKKPVEISIQTGRELLNSFFTIILFGLVLGEKRNYSFIFTTYSMPITCNKDQLSTSFFFGPVPIDLIGSSTQKSSWANQWFLQSKTALESLTDATPFVFSAFLKLDDMITYSATSSVFHISRISKAPSTPLNLNLDKFNELDYSVAFFIREPNLKCVYR